jgi:hypothetical protein
VHEKKCKQKKIAALAKLAVCADININKDSKEREEKPKAIKLTLNYK